MRKIAANIIFPIVSNPIKNSYIEINENGEIINVVDTKGNLREIAGLEYYSGVLIPGLILTENTTKEPGFVLNESSNINTKEFKFLWSRGVQAINEKLINEIDFSCFSLTDKLRNSFEKNLTQNTIENAQYLGFEKNLGSFEKGKKPGVLLISGYNFKAGELNAEAKIKRLV